MKAAYINKPGPPEQIHYGDLPRPEVSDRSVVVKVRAVSLNPIDTYVRSGLVAMDLPTPFIIGCDLAGDVEAIGDSVTRFKVGDRVWGSNQGLLGRQGVFAEFAAVDESWLYCLPKEVSYEDAAALALVGITAHLGLVMKGRVQSGETVLVNGGAGGVGSTVIQMAKAMGARVIATAGSDKRTERCQGLGADLALNYQSTGLDQSIQAFAPKGVDLIWETSRTPNLDDAIGRLAEGGRLIIMAGREARPEFPIGPFYVKGCSLHGFAMFKAAPEQQRDCAEDINRWLESETLRANIDKRFPLSESAAAHRLQEDNTLRQHGTLAGKIVLVP